MQFQLGPLPTYLSQHLQASVVLLMSDEVLLRQETHRKCSLLLEQPLDINRVITVVVIFFVSLQLLPDLTYTNQMTILCVFNGPDMVKHTEWNIGKFIEKKKALQV